MPGIVENSVVVIVWAGPTGKVKVFVSDNVVCSTEVRVSVTAGQKLAISRDQAIMRKGKPRQLSNRLKGRYGRRYSCCIADDM